MVSDVQGNVTVNYERPFGNSLVFSSMFDLFLTDDYDASATYDPALVQNKYSILSLRAAVGSESGSWQLALLAKNLTDEKILSFGGDTPLAGSTFGAKSNYAFFGPGRTLSAQVVFRF
jgi:hypothetical protein